MSIQYSCIFNMYNKHPETVMPVAKDVPGHVTPPLSGNHYFVSVSVKHIFSEGQRRFFILVNMVYLTTENASLSLQL